MTDDLGRRVKLVDLLPELEEREIIAQVTRFARLSIDLHANAKVVKSESTLVAERSADSKSSRRCDSLATWAESRDQASRMPVSARTQPDPYPGYTPN